MADITGKLQRVAALLAEIGKSEKKANEARQKLQTHPDFNAIQLFRMLTDSEEVLPEHLDWFFEDKVVRTTPEERELLFQALDRDQDGALSWSEFLSSCIGKDYAPDNNHFVTSWRDARTPPLPVQFAFMEVLLAEIDGLINIQDLRASVNQHLSESDWRAIFESIDQEGQGRLTSANIYGFLKAHHSSVTQTDAEAIFRRIDLNRDGYIDFQEFLHLSTFARVASREAQGSSQEIPRGPNGLATIPGPSTDSSRWFQSHNSWRGSGHKEGSKGITMRSTAEKTWNGTGYLNSAGKSTQKEYGSLFSSNQNTDRINAQEPTPKKGSEKQEHAIIVEERFDSRDQSSLGSQQQRYSAQSGREEQRHSAPRAKQAKSELLIEDGSRKVSHKDNSVHKPALPPLPERPDSRRKSSAAPERSLSRRSKASSVRYLKPGQESELSERSSATVRSKVLQNTLHSKFDQLKQLRNSEKVTLEREATRGVLAGGNNVEEDIFARKELTLVPRRDVPMPNESVHESERKTAYEDVVYQASETKYDLPRYSQAHAEKNSYSRFDISEGKRYSSHRNIEYISTVDGRSMRERDRLVEFFVNIVQDFRIVEQKRLNLAMRFDLKLDELFQNVDISEGDHISTSDMVRFFEEIELDASNEEAVLLLSRFDKNNDRYLDFAEFSQIFLPFNGKFREALLSKSSRQRGSIQLYDKNTLKALRDCLASIIDAERNLEHYKQVYQGRLHELFDLIDFQHTGRLVLEDFRQVFSAHEFVATDMEISALIYRFDLNLNGEITPDEFFSVLKDGPDLYQDQTLSQRGIAPTDLVFKSGKKVSTTTTRKTDYCTCVCRCYTTICHGCCRCETIEEVRYTKTPCRTSVKTVTETEETFTGGSADEGEEQVSVRKHYPSSKYNFDDTETTVRTVIQSAPRFRSTYVFDEVERNYPARRHKFGDRRYECGA